MNADAPSTIWDIPWQEFEVILGIKDSSLLRNLNIKTREQAEAFLKDCGFDSSEENQTKQFEQFFGEALFFIRHHLLSEEEREKLFVPPPVLYLERSSDLLLFASSKNPRDRYLRLWSCSLLKVMYAIANIQYSGRLQIIDDAREQIFKKIRKVTNQQGEEPHQLEYQNFFIHINKIEWKEAKTRTSIILKLLQKHDSIVDEVFDYLGVRFVVQKPNEIPLLIKFLIDENIIIPHQVVTLRTRNSIINIKNPKKILTFLKELHSSGTLNSEEFQNLCSNVTWHAENTDDAHKRTNAFSSQHYKSMQFTVRHLIRTNNPAFSVLESILYQLHKRTGLHRQEPWMEAVIPKYFTHYFPVEIQIMDIESYDLAKFGPASHEQYKAHQLKSVRDRVLGNLLSFEHEKLITQEIL